MNNCIKETNKQFLYVLKKLPLNRHLMCTLAMAIWGVFWVSAPLAICAAYGVNMWFALLAFFVGIVVAVLGIIWVAMLQENCK